MGSGYVKEYLSSVMGLPERKYLTGGWEVGGWEVGRERMRGEGERKGYFYPGQGWGYSWPWARQV